MSAGVLLDQTAVTGLFYINLVLIHAVH